jgi:diaminopimelate epimerase
MSITFRKMNGLGNDFVVLDARAKSIPLSASAVRAISNRGKGVGCDTVVVLERSARATVKASFFNADGSESPSCGNATRCIALLLSQSDSVAEPVIETSGGILRTRVLDGSRVTVDMGVPKFRWNEIPLAEPFNDTRKIELQIGPIDKPILHSPSVVNVGNPHCVFWVDDVDAYKLERFGPILENHPLFPERANVSVAQVTSRGSLRLRVWERGVGITQACGTGACAAAVCASRKGLTDRSVQVGLPGGDLEIEWRQDGHIWMTGPAKLDYESSLDPALMTAVNS